MTCEGDRRVPAARRVPVALGNSSDAIAQTSKALELDPSVRRGGGRQAVNARELTGLYSLSYPGGTTGPQNRRVTASNMVAQPRK